MRIAGTGLTDKGRIRPHNEDALLVDTARALFAVADGMGGHAAGEVASRLAIEAVEETLPRTPEPVANASQALAAAVEEANRRIARRMEERPEYRGMGTTLVLALVHGARLYVAHVGDSRAYLIRDGSIRQLTTDHSFVNELVRLGMLSREEAARDPRRNVVTRALGSGSVVPPDIHEEPLRAGDRVLLCSDGLNTMLQDKRILAILSGLGPDAAELDRACSALIAAANDAGGEDNVTVVLLQAETSGEPDEAPTGVIT